MLIDLTTPEIWTNPNPIFDAARAEGRTARTTTGDLVLLHAADIDEAHINKAFVMPGLDNLERLGIFDGPFYEWRSQAMAVMDGSDHRRLRSFVGDAFAPRQMERLRAMARERANALIDGRSKPDGMEILTEFASDLPLWTMCRFIGVDDADRERLGQSLVGTEEGFASPMTPERRKRCEDSIVVLNDYVIDLVRRRRKEPREDVVSMIVAGEQKPNGPTEREIVSLLVNVIGGSVGSTRASFANTIHEFARNPAEAEKVRQAASTEAAVEEGLRFNPPFRFGRRVVGKDVRLWDCDLQAGQSIFISRHAYNRDPERFEDPHRFDVTRPAKRHLSFGYGAHTCLGAAVARTNLQEGLRVFLERCRDIQLVEEPRRVPFVVDEQLESLHVRFRAA